MTPSKGGLDRSSDFREILLERKPGPNARGRLHAFETDPLVRRDRERDPSGLRRPRGWPR